MKSFIVATWNLICHMKSLLSSCHMISLLLSLSHEIIVVKLSHEIIVVYLSHWNHCCQVADIFVIWYHCWSQLSHETIVTVPHCHKKWNHSFWSQCVSGSIVVTTLDSGPGGSWFESRVGANHSMRLDRLHRAYPSLHPFGVVTLGTSPVEHQDSDWVWYRIDSCNCWTVFAGRQLCHNWSIQRYSRMG